MEFPSRILSWLEKRIPLGDQNSLRAMESHTEIQSEELNSVSVTEIMEIPHGNRILYRNSISGMCATPYS